MSHHQENTSLHLMILLVLLIILVSQTCANIMIDPKCPQTCNSVQIPFPFGIGDGCFLSPGFEIFCNQSTQSTPPLPFLAQTQYQVVSISNGELHINSTPLISTECLFGNNNFTHITLPDDSPYTISPSNMYTAIGCDTVAVITDEKSFSSGCVSQCASPSSVVNGSCSGIGCCESAIPKGKKHLSLGTGNMFNYMNVSTVYNCSYAFVVEKGSYTFVERDLKDFLTTGNIAMRLEWSIGDLDCSILSTSSCGENSFCMDSPTGTGYLCNCSGGYAGNPYVNGSQGCQDIDECLDLNRSPCVDGARCLNKVPGYKCICPFGNAGDGTHHGSGCKKIYLLAETVLGIGLGFAVVFLCGLWFYWALKKRTLIKLKEQYFRQNGGLLLKQVSSRECGTDCARVFTSDQIKVATQNYCETRILGTGGYGTVYKGIFNDGTVVAIKRSKVMDRSQINQFINEFVILTQINHRNVVKLLGCCLETEVPMLVYEYICNGTLHEHLHGTLSGTLISWANRLRIALETAEALSYLHSAASMPIFHRDVKSSNILLDKNYTAKVADFGISRLVPLDQTQIPTLVQGTLGYLDPEYFQTSQLTEKSDVYSFGVVLVELLTGQKPVSRERSHEVSNLAMYFLSSMRRKNITEFLDKNVLKEGNVDELRAVAELARKCLLLRSDKRPTMKEVAQEIARIAGYRKQTEVREDEEQALTLFENDQGSFGIETIKV